MAVKTITIYTCDVCGIEMRRVYGYINMHINEDHGLKQHYKELCIDCYKKFQDCFGEAKADRKRKDDELFEKVRLKVNNDYNKAKNNECDESCYTSTDNWAKSWTTDRIVGL